MTASEVSKQLEADPEWVAQRNAREQDQLEREQRSRQEQDALLQDLKSTGTIIDSVWDLVNTGKPYLEALPVLLDHLHRPYQDGIREGIARALAVKDARVSAWDRLIELVRRDPPGSGAKHGMMVAISAMARSTDLSVIIDLISDQSLGSCRLFLVKNLMRSKKQQAREVLLSLCDDPELHKEITFRLSRLPASNRGVVKV